MKRWHCYIAMGQWCAAADFDGPSKEEAKERAAKLWDEPVKHIAAHPTNECRSRGCQ